MTLHYPIISPIYDAMNADQEDDIPFYLQILAEVGGPFLDVGCGTGRILFPLLAQGSVAHGIDREEEMLKVATERSRALDSQEVSQLRLIQGDALHHAFTESYGLIALSYNFLMHVLQSEDQIQLFNNLRTASSSHTHLIIDLPHPEEMFNRLETNALMHERDIIHPASGRLIQIYSYSEVDVSNQIMVVTWWLDEISATGTVTRTVTKQRLRFYTKAELSLILQLSGWRELAAYGDYDRSPFEDGSERMILVAGLNSE